MNISQCFGGFRSSRNVFQYACLRRPRNGQKLSTSLVLQKLGLQDVSDSRPVPKMSGVSNSELGERLEKFREVAVLPRHLAKNQQVLVYNKKYASMLENEKIIARIAGEEFRLKYINVIKDIPRMKMFLYDILPLMKEKEDWRVLPNILHGLKNTGFKLKLPIAEKLVRTACINGRQNVILECLRRTKDTGMDLSQPNFTKTVLFWICFKAIEQDQSIECVSKSLSMAEQILEMLEDEKYTGSKYKDVSTHQRNHPEILGIPLCIAAFRASKFKDNKDKDFQVAKYATEFVCKSVATPLLPSSDTITQAQTVQDLENKVKNLRNTQKDQELTKAIKSRNYEREILKSRIAKLLHWLMINILVVKGIRLALPILGPTFQHKQQLQERLAELEKNNESIQSVWREVHTIQGKDPQSFIMSKLLRLDTYT
ncbi:hypothetical protein OnM2_073055 [Erysiphe neolycopersici]|uniref:Uncharacterized protein n=1 Tax=Erysiphe neolycopersici TaxID=212602 RepID=A0A420HJG9_9PEZI|nr:hypothetical protein OnM2_073055 [Erysiphe neolycopersici]